MLVLWAHEQNLVITAFALCSMWAWGWCSPDTECAARCLCLCMERACTCWTYPYCWMLAPWARAGAECSKRCPCACSMWAWGGAALTWSVPRGAFVCAWSVCVTLSEMSKHNHVKLVVRDDASIGGKWFARSRNTQTSPQQPSQHHNRSEPLQQEKQSHDVEYCLPAQLPSRPADADCSQQCKPAQAHDTTQQQVTEVSKRKRMSCFNKSVSPSARLTASWASSVFLSPCSLPLKCNWCSQRKTDKVRFSTLNATTDSSAGERQRL